MSRRNAVEFLCVRTEGALLPPDVLRRVAEADPALGGLRPEDYHLAPNERLNEAINRSWNRLVSAWGAFAEARRGLGPDQAGTGVTRERWLLPLFQELGYGRLPAARAREIGGDTFPISHEWHRSPIHLVGCGVDLDRRSAGVAGAARTSPHGLVQQFLNRSDDHLWGFVSNGLRLRVLRDNVSITRQAYLEFDLEAMMEGEVFSDFALLWLVCHQSRVEAEVPEECWLERWVRAAHDEGARALDALCDGVGRAIEALGTGFLAHPENRPLRDRLRAGELAGQDYYRELLRLVYRLLFLFVAEDRGVLLDPAAPEEAKERFGRFYGTRRLRRLAQRRPGTRHHDLFEGVRVVMARLGDPNGCPELALPFLGSFLWSPGAAPHLTGEAGEPPARIQNRHLLDAVRALAFVERAGVLRPVDYKNLGAEELGSVYESLLELHPEIHLDSASFALKTASGHERKTTGSYYTPTSLIQSLLETALDPVIEARLESVRRVASGKGEASREVGGRGRGGDERGVLSGPQSVAGGDAPGGGLLPGDQGVPPGGVVRDGGPDPEGLGVDPGEHRGGLGTGGNPRIHSVPQGSPRQPEGAGDPRDPLPAGGVAERGSGRIDSGSLHRGGQDDTLPDWLLAAQVAVGPDSLPPYSLLAEQALLSLRVCDPACGSGHFLVAAAHRLAKRLAAVRTGDDEPSPEAYRQALRDVVGHCLYGVDLNPMAVELCKVALWIEAVEPGRPLTFLDHRIRCGNSLLGATPELLAQGIPDDAFAPIEGDDPEVAREWRARNRQERAGQTDLEALVPAASNLEDLARRAAALDSLEDADAEGLRAKENAYRALQESGELARARLAADAWCAAFVWPKRLGAPPPVTSGVLRELFEGEGRVDPATLREVRRIAADYRFFHWHLAFPEVFCLDAGRGGFTVVLGNPPWERVKLQEKEFFAGPRPDIAAAPNAATRRRMIEALRAGDPVLYEAFVAAKRRAEGESQWVRRSGRYPLCGRGDVNTYALFAELNASLVAEDGRVGCILPSGIATDDTTKFFFQHLMGNGLLVSFLDFENREKIFPAVDSRQKFALVTLAGSRDPARAAEFAFFLHGVAEAKDPERRFRLTGTDVALLNPNTRTCPIFRRRRDAELTKYIYSRVPVLLREGGGRGTDDNPWGVSFVRLFDMSNDSSLFRTQDQLLREGWELRGNLFERDGELYLPLYEAKMVHHFDHRFGDYADLPPGSKSTQLPDVPLQRKQDPAYVPLPRYWVPDEVRARLAGRWTRGWLLGWRDICRSTDERTVIASAIPAVGVGDTFLLMLPAVAHGNPVPLLVACLNTLACDYVARQKIGGTHLKFHVFKQLAVLLPGKYGNDCPWAAGDETLLDWCRPRLLELTFTSWDLAEFGDAIAPTPEVGRSPFRWVADRRFLLRCELDAAFFHLYLGSPREWREKGSPELLRYFPTPRDAVEYILDTFPIVRRKDEQAYGEYRTKRVILEIYDAMLEAIEGGRPYQTRLDPPPAHPSLRHPDTPPPWLDLYRRLAYAAPGPEGAEPEPGPSKPKRKRRSRAATAGQLTFAFDAAQAPASEPAAGESASAPTPDAPLPTRHSPLAAALDYLRTHPGPRSRAEICEALGLTASEWLPLSRQLAEHPQVERTGQKRGTRYRWRGGGENL